MARWRSIAIVHEDWQPRASAKLPFEFETGLRLEAIPADARSGTAFKDLSPHDRQRMWHSSYCLTCEYEAENDGEVDPTEPVRALPASKQQGAYERFAHVNQAMWLAKPTVFAFARVIDQSEQDGEWLLRGSGRVDPVGVRTSHGSARHDGEDLRRVLGVYRVIRSLYRDDQARYSLLWSARRSLWIALRAREPEVRFMLVWIALEALFGPKSGKKIGKSISERMAAFLPLGEGADRTAASVRQSYRLRSKVVHGRPLPPVEDESVEPLVETTEELLRHSLLRILGDPELPETFSSDKREPYLRDLTALP